MRLVCDVVLLSYLEKTETGLESDGEDAVAESKLLKELLLDPRFNPPSNCGVADCCSTRP